MKAPAIEFAQNYVGLLPSWLKSALYNYLEYPTNDNWNEIYSYVIAPGRIGTVWQAVLEIDPTFPDKVPMSAHDSMDTQWPRLPEPELVQAAIANLVFKNLNLN